MKPKLEAIEPEIGSSFDFLRGNVASITCDWHFHDKFELVYFFGFSGTYTIGDHTGPLKSGKSGSIYLIAPLLPHSWVLDRTHRSTSSSSLVYFSKPMIDTAQVSFPELSALNGMLEDSKLGVVFPPCREISDIGESIAQLGHLQGCRKISEFIIVLERLRRCHYKTLSSVENNHGLEPKEDRRLDLALEYICSHFTQPINLKTVSKIACMSPSYFCRRFKALYGVTFLTYVSNLRITLMCKLLEETSKSVSIIALETGFNNVSNCNRNFKNQLKMTPLEYRSHFQS